MAQKELRPGSVGLWELVFQSMGQITPITILSGLILSIVGFSGGSAPLVMFVSMLAVLLSANTIYQYSGRIAHAGGYYAYVWHDMGASFGLFTGFLYILYQVSNLGLEYLIVAWGFSKSLNYALGTSLPVWTGVIWAASMTALSYALMRKGVKPSLKLALALGLIQVLFIIGLSAVIITRATDNTLTVFTPSLSPGGWTGVFTGFIAGGYLAFAGYGSVVPMGEEAKAARETIRKAVLYAVILAGLAFVVGSYAMVVGYGISNIGSFTAQVIPGLIVARRFTGDIGAYLFILIGTFLSTYGTIVGMGTPLSRVIFSMARDGALPDFLARTSDGTPKSAVNASYAISITVAVVTGLAFYVALGFYNGLYAAWAIFGIIATLANLLIHVMVNTSLSTGSLRKGGSLIKELIFPTATTVIMIVAFYFSLMGLSWPFSIAPLVFVIWVLVSAGWVIGLKKTKGHQIAVNHGVSGVDRFDLAERGRFC